MRTMIWSRIYPVASNRILKHIGWSMRASSSMKLSETQAPVLVFHLFVQFSCLWLKSTLPVSGNEKEKRYEATLSQALCLRPLIRDSVACLFLIARKLGNQVSAPRSETKNRKDWVSPSMLSPPSACEKLCSNRRKWKYPQSALMNLALFIPVPGPGGIWARSPWSPSIVIVHTPTWIIQGKSMVYPGNRFAGCQEPGIIPQHPPPPHPTPSDLGSASSLSGPMVECWCINKILFPCKKWPRKWKSTSFISNLSPVFIESLRV